MEVEEQRLETEKWLLQYLDRTQPRLIDNKLSLFLDTIRQANSKCASDIVTMPTQFHKLVKEWAMSQLGVSDTKKQSANVKQPIVRVNFEGHLGANFVSPRGLTAQMANQLVGVQGIVTRMSIPKNLLIKSCHYCPKTSNTSTKDYPDEYCPEETFDLRRNKTIPLTDINQNPLSFEFGKSTFKDFQTLVVQQLPEMSPPGQLPRSVTVILEDHLVDKIKPGDRVQAIGVFRLHVGNQSRVAGIMKPNLLCTSIVPLHDQRLPLATIKPNLKMPYPESQLFNLFSQSVCPSIYGHEQLKKAVLLMLLGGCEKVLDNKTHLRGDINILMVGDPGTAKSQILRWVSSTADVAVGTTGSGASGVGLTAAVTNDPETGQRNLEPGAMVLADRGFVCIDQFDKMNEVDRVAVHEVMEQQTVTIAKAGIHCSLNARCSVIAAANPIHGQYNRDLPPTKNVGMPDSLLSRFDLIFIIKDEKDSEKDMKIAQRVCKNHRYSPIDPTALHQMNEDYIIEPAEMTQKEEVMFEKSNLFKGESRTEILTQGYLRQYVNYCRKSIFPTLGDKAIDLIKELWSTLREKESEERGGVKVLPVTIRSLETMIRLSTAHAKLRMSGDVEAKDVIEAYKLLAFCLGDEQTVDSTLRECMKNAGINEKTMDVEEQSSKPSKSKTQDRSKTQKTDNISSQMAKMSIGEEQREIQRVTQIKTRSKNKQTILAAVFKKVTDMMKKKKTGKMPRKQLYKQLSQYEEKDIDVALEQLASREKVQINGDDILEL